MRNCTGVVDRNAIDETVAVLRAEPASNALGKSARRLVLRRGQVRQMNIG